MISVTSVFDWMIINADGRTNLFSFPPLWRRRISVSHKGKRDTERKTKGAHLWALCDGWAIRPFQHRGLAPFVTWPAVGTYGTSGCRTPPSPPWGSPGRAHSTYNTPLNKHATWGHVYYLKRYAGSLWTNMCDGITFGYFLSDTFAMLCCNFVMPLLQLSLWICNDFLNNC